jgi:hypothetical protein
MNSPTHQSLDDKEKVFDRIIPDKFRPVIDRDACLQCQPQLII